MPDDPKKPDPNENIPVDHAPPTTIESLLRDRDELTALRARQADDVARRLAKLPVAVRARLPHGAGVAESEAFLIGIESALPGAPLAPAFIPPAGRGPSDGQLFESDLEAMPQTEREALFRSDKFRRAVQEGRFVRRHEEKLYR